MNRIREGSPSAERTQIVAYFCYIVSVALLLEHGLDAAFGSLWNLIDVLRLNDGLEVIFEDLGEVVLKL